MLKSPLLPLGLGLAVLAAGCGGSEPQVTRSAASATEQLPAGRIAFRRYSDAAQTHGAIFTIRTDGTGERRLTNPPDGTSDDKPDWSPDGKQVVFQHCGDGMPCSVWTMPATGGKATEVRVHCRLKGDCDTSDPSWTPDGRIVLTLSQGSVRTLGGQDQIQRSAIELVNPRTGHQRTIIALNGWKGDLLTPAMSPDRRTVAYTHSNAVRIKPSAGEALFTVGVDGRGNRRVAPWDLGGGDGPSFSPTGTILFRSHAGHDDNRQSDFWTVRPDGSRLKQLTHFKEGTLVRSASYSPDGDWIVSATDGVGGNADLFAMHANGSGKVFITRTELWDSAPDWSPKDVTR